MFYINIDFFCMHRRNLTRLGSGCLTVCQTKCSSFLSCLHKKLLVRWQTIFITRLLLLNHYCHLTPASLFSFWGMPMKRESIMGYWSEAVCQATGCYVGLIPEKRQKNAAILIIVWIISNKNSEPICYCLNRKMYMLVCQVVQSNSTIYLCYRLHLVHSLILNSFKLQKLFRNFMRTSAASLMFLPFLESQDRRDGHQPSLHSAQDGQFRACQASALFLWGAFESLGERDACEEFWRRVNFTLA